MNPELLNCEFQVSDEPGLDTRDPRFADIAGMVQQGDFLGAATQAQEIIEDNIYDIRIICYFLYGLFDQDGPSSFVNIFNSLKIILSDNWEAVGPLKNRLKHAKKSIVWLFKQLNKVLENEKKKESAKWQDWLVNVSSDEIWDAMEAAKDLQKAIIAVFEDSSTDILDGLSKIKAWLDGFYRLVYKEPEPEPEDEAEEPESDDSADFADNAGQPVESTRSAPISDNNIMYGNISSSGSYLLQMLLKKMDVFSRLLSENKTAGAALVAEDINGIINDFDPQIYFPDLFADFTRQYALNVDDLLAFKKCHNTALWKSMDKLYRVDMDTFVNLDCEFHSSDPDSFHIEGGNGDAGGGSSSAYRDESGQNDNDEDAYYEDDVDDDF